MSSRKFKFISPGIFINEIDRSQIGGLPAAVGPAIIGRFEKGPVLTPVQVNSFEDFVLTFGNPIAGGGAGDMFRDGNYSAPTYGAYAVQAYLRNNSPVTVVRLLGDTNNEASGVAKSLAGWRTDNLDINAPDVGDQGGAFGLFVAKHPELNSYTIDFDISGLVEVTGTFSGSVAAGAFILTSSGESTPSSSFDSATGTGFFGTGSNNTQNAANFAAAVNSASAADGYGGFSATSSGTVATITLSSVYSHLKIDNTIDYTVVLTGAATNDTQNDVVANNTFAYATGSAFAATGTLAAVWYANEGTVQLDGNDLSTGSVAVTGSGIFLRPVEDGTFKAIVKDNSGTTITRTSFNFNSNSGKFVRKRFNTNPTLTNSEITSETTSYWLGETYEGNVKEVLGAVNFDKDTSFGAIIPLTSPDGSNFAGADFKLTSGEMDAGQGVLAKTGWFIAQDLDTDYDNFDPANMEKLFRLVGRLTREDVQRKVKISIQDIRVSEDPNNDFGSFTVAIRDIKDTDDNPIYLEQYNNCNLNPASDNFISKKIGDKYEKWDYDNKLYREYGNYTNISKFVRVELSDRLERNQLDARLLPFGFFGPPVFNPFTIDGAGDAFKAIDGAILENTDANGTLIYCDTNYTGSYEDNDGAPVSTTGTFGPDAGLSDTFTGSIRLSFPELRLRVSSSEGFLQDPTDAFFGVDTTYNSNVFDKSVLDVIRSKPAGVGSYSANTTDTTNSFVFTLDNIRNVAATAEDFTGAYKIDAVYDENARKNKTAYNVLSGAVGVTTPTYEDVLDAGFDRFTTVLHGGFDAVDITEREPFRNSFMSAAGTTAATNYAYNSLELAIDSLRDPERVEYNLIAMPGITNTNLNIKLIRNTEARGDAMAIVDPAGGYVPDTENTSDESSRLGSVTAVVNEVKNNLRVNSSYGATYYPWVQIRDTVNGANVWAPPSVAAIGALGYSESVSELWFAPAGFTRGGLSANNAAGLPVVGVRQRLTSKDRDKLYETNINPIASFPAEGIVIFGQKTLQVTPSALDRINVRRLAIYLKREISRIAATLLFDQNVQTTWNRFKGQAESLLADVKAGLGLSDYKVVLDETTTTPDLIDRNILYAKIFVKPARAIEFIAIDFIITDSGASFDD